jgi:ankyrin repeat protein
MTNSLRFLWVKVKIEDLCAAQNDDQISQILNELPKGLYETYSRCLEKIANNQEPLYAFNILRWVSHAKRPLRLEELEEALTFDPKVGDWDASKRPNISIVEICANLVIIDEANEIKLVRLAHPTVKQFLEKPAEGPGAKEFLKKIHHNELSTFNFGPNDLEVGEYCISYLFASEFQHYCPAENRSRPIVKNIVNNPPSASEVDLNKYKLLTYAKANWVHHTLAFSKNSLLWEHFQILVLLPDGPWAGQPLNSHNSKVKHCYGQFKWAIENGHITLLRLLRDNKEVFRNLCSQKIADDGFLLNADMKGRENIAELLLEGVEINSTDDWGQTELHRAIAKGHEAAAKLLLAKDGVDLDSEDYYGRTPLSWAAGSGQEGVAKLLLARKGVDIDSRDKSGRTPLSWAAGSGQEAVAKLLLARKGVDVDSKDNSCATPLSWAAGNGHVAVVQLLLAKKGVDINSKETYDRRTPLSWAAGNGHVVVAKLLLAKEGVDVDSKDRSGRTPLSWAAGNGRTVVAKLLLAKGGVDVDSKDRSGRTPLSWAAGSGRTVVAKLLLAKGGVDVNSKDRSGRTPLSWAAGNKEVELLLAKEGADVDSKDRVRRRGRGRPGTGVRW